MEQPASCRSARRPSTSFAATSALPPLQPPCCSDGRGRWAPGAHGRPSRASRAACHRSPPPCWPAGGRGGRSQAAGVAKAPAARAHRRRRCNVAGRGGGVPARPPAAGAGGSHHRRGGGHRSCRCHTLCPARWVGGRGVGGREVARPPLPAPPPPPPPHTHTLQAPRWWCQTWMQLQRRRPWVRAAGVLRGARSGPETTSTHPPTHPPAPPRPPPQTLSATATARRWRSRATSPTPPFPRAWRRR